MDGELSDFWISGWSEYFVLLNIWERKTGQTKEQKAEFSHSELDGMYAALAEKMNGTETRNTTS